MSVKKNPANTTRKNSPIKRRKRIRPLRDPRQPLIGKCPKCGTAQVVSVIDRFMGDLPRCSVCLTNFLDTVAPYLIEQKGNNG